VLFRSPQNPKTPTTIKWWIDYKFIFIVKIWWLKKSHLSIPLRHMLACNEVTTGFSMKAAYFCEGRTPWCAPIFWPLACPDYLIVALSPSRCRCCTIGATVVPQTSRPLSARALEYSTSVKVAIDLRSQWWIYLYRYLPRSWAPL
jgi:hypothetical protein